MAVVVLLGPWQLSLGHACGGVGEVVLTVGVDAVLREANKYLKLVRSWQEAI